MDYKALFLTNAGRLNRQRYWIGVIILFVIQIVWYVLVVLILGDSDVSRVLIGLVYLAAIILGINLGIKRFHDRDKSGWWVLIALIPIIGPIWYFIEVGCLPGTAGPNSYGPDPLGT